MTQQKSPIETGRATIPLTVAVAAVAVNLRPVITTVGPQLDVVTHHLGAGEFTAGLITAVPVFAFAAISLASPKILSRFSIRHGLYLALTITGAGIVVRPWAGTAGFVLATFASALGVGVISVLLPALIRSAATGSGRLVTVFTTALQAGAAVGFAAAVPLAQAIGDWQLALASWAVLAPLAAVVLRLSPDVSTGAERAVNPPSLNPLRAVGRYRAYGLTVFFGLQAMVAFVVMGWLPSILQAAGVSSSTAGIYLAALTFVAVPISLVVPPVVARSQHPAFWLAGFSLFAVAGIVGFLVAPAAAPLAWSILLGIGTSVFSLVLTVITVRAPSPGEAIAFSGSVQGVGYLIASIGPFAVGFLRDQGGGWTLPLGVLLAVALLQTVVGAGIGAGTPVDADPSNTDRDDPPRRP